jgi:hypothetical protein
MIGRFIPFKKQVPSPKMADDLAIEPSGENSGNKDRACSRTTSKGFA